MTTGVARYPYQTAITAYGNGGFRFADMSHKGSIVCLPSGIFAWGARDAAALTIDHFARVFADFASPGALLLGTGAAQIWPSAEIASAFAARGLALEPMSTGAAARTYNVLLAEKRHVAAALIAVD